MNGWQELGEFREKTRLFYAGEMSKGDYKGFSGKFGSYAQRGRQGRYAPSPSDGGPH